MIEITNITQLIQPHLKPDTQIVSYLTENLVPAGENYGSVILALSIKLSNGEILQLVAKLNPATELFKKIFNIPIAFRKEAEFYKTIIPFLHKFQDECNVPRLNSFVNYYGSRYSLDSNPTSFDDNACLLLENIKFKGFACIKRTQSYDLCTAKYIMKMMAHFHALPIAIKIKRPNEFCRIREHLRLNLTDPEVSEQHIIKVNGITQYALSKDKEIMQYANRVVALMHHTARRYTAMQVQGNEPFNTITHNDMWIANIMLKLNQDGQPISDRLVDYQMAAFGNPANDILFFIHTSVKAAMITDHYDDLIDCYYDEFISKLRQYNVDVKPFRKDVLLSEIDEAAKEVQFYHILFMTVTVFLEANLDEVDDILRNSNGDLSSIVHPAYAPQLRAIVMNYIKHNWL